MSLIEQAAKRLDELRRSGVAAAPTANEPAVAPAEAPAQPTPEGIVRAIEARGESLLAPRGASQEVPLARALPPLHPAPAAQPSAPRAPARRLDIDLARLRARGFLTPDVTSSQLSDEFRVIKRPIIRNALGKDGARLRHGNLVMVTSALPGEGKTFTAVNLAMSIASEFDSTVLLIDGDVANPALPRLLGVPETPGLLDLLTHDGMDVGETLIRTNVEKLSLIPAGKPNVRSTELLASAQMAKLLDEVSSRYPDRIIVFDSPPLLATTEARVLASHMGQLVMVVAAETTTQGVLTQALATVEACPVVMMLLNKASQSDVGTYYGYPVAEART